LTNIHSLNAEEKNNLYQYISVFKPPPKKIYMIVEKRYFFKRILVLVLLAIVLSVLVLLAIALSVLQFTSSNYPIGILKVCGFFPDSLVSSEF
jgi:lipopolysaccharide/colanic/teichoic acid biosynthesis glycosyltransferase